MLDERRHDAEIPRPQRLQRTDSLAEIFISANTVSSGVVTAYRSGRFTMRQIAEHLGVHYCTISRMVARHEMLDRKT
jgi:hypothetical protein